MSREFRETKWRRHPESRQTARRDGRTAFRGCFRFGSIQVNRRQSEVFRNGELVVLCARQFKLLRHFIEHQGVTLSREELLERVWEYDPESCTRTVDIHVAWLRQKLDDNPKYAQWIHAVRGLRV